MTKKKKKRPEQLVGRGFRELAGGTVLTTLSPLTNRPEGVVLVGGTGLLLAGKGFKDISKGLKGEVSSSRRGARKEFG